MKKILLTLALILAAGLGVYGVYAWHYAPRPQSSSAAPAYTAPPLTQQYANDAYRFSLMMPADFAASESEDPSASSTTVVLQNSTGDGVQIVVTPFDDDPNDGSGYTLTKERILQDVPDLAIADGQPVNVGTNYVGLAFKSDNPAFCAPPEPCAEGGGGASREVWFVYPECNRGVCSGNLYQITTYARLDPLLQAIFKTWQFN